MKSNDSGIHKTGKSHQAGPGGSRAISKRSRKGMGRAALDSKKMGASNTDTERRNAGSPLADTVSARAKAEAIQALDAPVTVTITGRTAAALRFSSYVLDVTPEENAFDAIKCILRTHLSELPGLVETSEAKGDSALEQWMEGGKHS